MVPATALPAPLSDRTVPWRLGLVTLASDPTIEDSFKRMLAQTDQVAVHINRIRFDGGIEIENLRAMEADICATAREILTGDRLDAVLYGCTSASAAIGDDAVLAQLRRAKPGARGFATPVTGVLAAMKALNVRKLSVLTPYPVSVTEMLGHYMETLGAEITSLHCLGLEDDWDNGCVSEEDLLELAKNLPHSGADAVFLSCTALRGAEISQRLEHHLGLPVISSNQALLWHGLRLAGCPVHLHGFGRLMTL